MTVRKCEDPNCPCQLMELGAEHIDTLDASPPPGAAEQRQLMAPSYLGDGVYVSFDGFQLWLAANDHRNKVIALENAVFKSLVEYAGRFWRVGDLPQRQAEEKLGRLRALVVTLYAVISPSIISDLEFGVAMAGGAHEARAEKMSRNLAVLRKALGDLEELT